jgi:ABC-type glucose/galactose transport system permease subunit
MAKVYHPKSTTTKLMEGAIGGLVFGAVMGLIVLLSDLLTPDRSWWSTISIVGQLVTGQQETNTSAPDMASLIIGLLINLVLVVLIGIGFGYYMPLFRRFNVHPIIGGVIYGLVIWIVLDLLFLAPATGNRVNLIWLLVADLLGGAALGWWFSRPSKPAPQS